MQARFVYLWEYRVAPEHRELFRALYGPEGGWVRLFRQYAGYRQTLLLEDREDPGRFVTVDLWESKTAFEAFRESAASEFAQLDAQGEGLTEEERSLGEFRLGG